MADDQPITDPELLPIEQLLRGASLVPSTADRDRVLFAAGAAAGRQQLKRQFRIVAGVAAVLAISTVSLGTALLTRSAAPVVAIEDRTPPKEPDVSPLPRPRTELAVDSVPRFESNSLRVRDRFDFESLANRTTSPSEIPPGPPPELVETGPRLRAGSKDWFVESL